MYYLLFIWGSVEPELQGPFMDFDALLTHSREVCARESDEKHGYFILKQEEDKISVEAFDPEMLESDK